MIKKLSRRTHHHKTAVGMRRRRGVAPGGQGAGHRIEPILPEQFIRECKGILLEVETAALEFNIGNHACGPLYRLIRKV